jgi:hypothetical protein
MQPRLLPLLLVYHRTGFEKGEAGCGGGGVEQGGGRGGGGAVQHRHPGQVHHAVELGPLLQK